MTAILAILLLIASSAAPPVDAQNIPAFSGADGAARNVSGGRGGIVYHVTKLNSAIDDPQRNDFGTLRYGLNSGNFPAGLPRTIVFDVGGVFHLGRLPQTGWDPNGNGWDAQSRLTIGGSNVTFAGQTAPGAGVIFMGGGLKPQGNNNIIRNLTVASGYGLTGWWKPGDPFRAPPGTPEAGTDASQWFPDNTVYDGMDISGTNIMIDHVSTLYSTDESVSMNEVANNITVQYSNIAQGLNYPQWDAEGGGLTGHAFGSLLTAGNTSAAAISFHHNLYAHFKGRVPQVGNGGAGGYYDFRNNVFYNWLGTAGSKGGTTFVNLVGNFYLAGDGGDQPLGGTNPGLTTQTGGTGVLGASTSVHRSGNLLDSNKDDDANDGANLAAGGAASPLWAGGTPTYVGTTDTATQAFNRVLNYVGPHWWTRDAVPNTPDERIINETLTGTGKIIAWVDDPWNGADGGEWQALKNTAPVSRAAAWDEEVSVGYGTGDGMPSYWEVQHGLSPTVRDDADDFDADGYTNLEEYLNDIAAWPAPNAIVFNNKNEDGRYAHILNWDANPAAPEHPWQPSRFDTAVIDNGTVIVDAVGQHAGNLLLATQGGNNATLNITDGWLVVEDAPHGLSDGIVVIGDSPTATAMLNLSGGQLSAKTLLKGAGGTFNFTGGVLSAETINFSVENNGGTLSPGTSPGTTTINGDFTIHSGSLAIELAASDFDSVDVTQSVTLGGDLLVTLLDGFTPNAADSFEILSGNAVSGSFANVATGERIGITGADGSFLVTIGGDHVTLSDFSLAPPILAGDFNDDGVVDAADYVVWQKLAGTNAMLPNETASPGTVDGDDYNEWQQNLETGGNGGGSGPAAPEPTVFALLLAGSMTHASLIVRLFRTA